ncbi:hypothetical protein BASA83_013444 [Batrachochytrium salamandrivorans]|nr:hypothetical protein BASA83_013444 [Batrachochytrium salamandrivorans]
MDSKLAADLQIPLLELSTPITLRLADGDSSSSLTHQNRSTPIAYWKACGDGNILCNRPLSRFHSWIFVGLGKPPNISKTFDSPLAPDTTSNPVELSPIDCSLSNFISLGSMQTDVHPFVKVSPISDVSIPPDILSQLFFIVFRGSKSYPHSSTWKTQ